MEEATALELATQYLRTEWVQTSHPDAARVESALVSIRCLDRFTGLLTGRRMKYPTDKGRLLLAAICSSDPSEAAKAVLLEFSEELASRV